MMPLATSSGSSSSSSTGASAVTTSSFISASMAARKEGLGQHLAQRGRGGKTTASPEPR